MHRIQSSVKHVKTWVGSIWIPRTMKDLEWLYKLNPTTPTHLPTSEEYRVVAPASQKKYVAPVNDTIHHHYYYTRDTRRAFPQTLVYTQSDITKLVEAQKVAAIGSGPIVETSVAVAEPVVNSVSVDAALPPILDQRRRYRQADIQQQFDGYNPEYHCVTNRSAM